MQGFINSGISAGSYLVESAITGQFNSLAFLATVGFGFVGGAIVVGSWGKGWRNIIVGIGLGGIEDASNWIFVW